MEGGLVSPPKQGLVGLQHPGLGSSALAPLAPGLGARPVCCGVLWPPWPRPAKPVLSPFWA